MFVAVGLVLNLCPVICKRPDPAVKPDPEGFRDHLGSDKAMSNSRNAVQLKTQERLTSSSSSSSSGAGDGDGNGSIVT